MLLADESFRQITISMEYFISASTLVWLAGDGGAKPRGLLLGNSSSDNWYWAPATPFLALFLLYILYQQSLVFSISQSQYRSRRNSQKWNSILFIYEEKYFECGRTW